MHHLASGGFSSVTSWSLPLGILVSLMKSGSHFSYRTLGMKISAAMALFKGFGSPHYELSQ